MKSITNTLLLRGLLATELLVSAAGKMQAQRTAQQLFACYVPTTRTVYVIEQPSLRSQCSSGHVEFSWIAAGDGTEATAAEVVNDPNGWAATGTFGTGAIPVTGPGVRLMWYPRKAAIRAGGVEAQWNDANVGDYSVALGQNTTASAHHSTALGIYSAATGPFSTALGIATRASSHSAIAMGQNTTASDTNSTALGLGTTASGPRSMAMGSNASTNLMSGSFVYGDASTSDTVTATTPNSFVVRASGGFRFRTSPTLTTGCDISGGTSAGNLACSGTIHSASGGFRFPDNTVQTTAATAGVSGWQLVSASSQPDMAPGAIANVFALCPVGKKVLGGGASSGLQDGFHVTLVQSSSLFRADGREGWSAAWRNDTNATLVNLSLDVHLQCANAG